MDRLLLNTYIISPTETIIHIHETNDIIKLINIRVDKEFFKTIAFTSLFYPNLGI